MRTYTTKQELIDAIIKSAKNFIVEFNDIADEEKNLRREGEEKTPYEMLVYQLGWLDLIKSCDDDEKSGKTVIAPTLNIKWNKLGELTKTFYEKYQNDDWAELKELFNKKVDVAIKWTESFTEQEPFEPNHRNWSGSTPNKWAIYKWIHINTVAPFTNFRSKIRKWKKAKI
jgi:hypothetical protein